MAVPTGMWGVAIFASHFNSKHNMETNGIDYKGLAQSARRELNERMEGFISRMGWLKEYLQQLLDDMDTLAKENQIQKAKIDSLQERIRKDQLNIQQKEQEHKAECVKYQEQIAEEKRLRMELEMKMTEMTKLSTNVAKKSPEEDLIKGIRTYVNHSKQKRPDKRAKAKEAALDMVLANKLTLPEDLAAAIESLDDEQPEPKVVNVGNGGHYNDIHDNKEVKV